VAEAQAAARVRLKEYETIYILRSDVDRDGAQKVATRVEEVFGREGGRLTRVETWGRRVLAYPVAKQKRGVYVYLRFIGGGGLVTELERNLRMLDPVIKFMTVRLAEDVDPAALSIDPADVKFEAIEAPPPDEEAEESLERQLGLEDAEHVQIMKPSETPERPEGEEGEAAGEEEAEEET
jgi:small subunit ribosomal protein S6